MPAFELRFSPFLFILISLLLLLVPLRWLLAIVFSIILHESFHLGAIKLLGGEVKGVSVGCGGIELRTAPMPCWKELLCAAAGPVSFLLPLLFARLVPAVAICSLVHSVYNLLPIFPLDGGRILRCICGTAENLFVFIQTAVLLGIVLLGGYLTVFLKMGILPLVAGLAVLGKASKEKFLAKLAN